MKMTLLSPLCLVIWVLCPGCTSPQSGSAKSDSNLGLNSTIYLQNAHANLSEGNTLGQNPKTVVGTPAFNQMIGDFESYRENMTMVVQDEADTRRERDEFSTLIDVAEQAVKAKDSDEQIHLFGNYLYDSRNFLIRYPDYPGDKHLWVLRGVAALRLNKPVVGYEAGRVLFALPAEERADPHVAKILDALDKQGWLARDKLAADKPAN